jgi:molecular chaperone HscB
MDERWRQPATRVCRYFFACRSTMSGPVDHFARFGLPRSYPVDRKALDAAYERLSFALHPDLLANAGDDEKQAAQQASAELNEGYKIISSESERAAYLLRLLSGDAKLNTEALPDGFLQAMFMLQEEVDDLDPDNVTRRAEVKADVETRMHQVQENRAALFALTEKNPKGVDEDLLQGIQSNLNEERYLRRLLERL